MGKNKDFLDSAASSYIKALEWELSQWEGNFSIGTVYFGGGTPSLLSLGQLEELTSFIRRSFDCEKNAEFSLEANPSSLKGHVGVEKLKGLACLGFNRISFGVESLNEQTLRGLYRDYGFEDLAFIVEACREARLSNINFDLICGLPRETKADFSRTLALAVSLNPAHMSVYPLQIEEGTFFERAGFGADYDRQADEYLDAHQYLTRRGFKHYEIANFAKPGFESQHNLAYWRYDDYLGVGLGAASKVGKKTWTNVRKYPNYIHAFERRMPLVEEKQILSEQELLQRQIILGLRLKDGVSTQLLAERVDPDVFSQFKSKGYLTNKNGSVSLTPEGWLVSNQLFKVISDRHYLKFRG